ncbi:S9 family peptidase [Caulobacter sp. SSI4214]|uniref:alpha/beta hydrolase family protein n=1 Tax=Caulobacter sp. SSI4214 TaxID=2575739 RepID=UPI00143C8041|nr:S9 family peptidase [Caulobacter sp. SSI4214]
MRTKRPQPVLKIDSNARGTTAWIYGRGPEEKGWRLLRKSRFNEQRKLPEFDIVGATEEPGVLLVCSRPEGADKAIIRTFDARNNAFGSTICQRDDAEITDAFIDKRRRFLAGVYTQDRIAYEFADPSLSAHFKALNTYFGNRSNVRIHDVDTAQQSFVLAVSGPTEPTTFHHYDRRSRKVTPLGSSQRRLSADRLAPMRTLDVTTRDGARITAYLTTPLSSAGPPPLVVLPHGGPEARDVYDWNIWAQALASQGWAVLQPNFRGSGGYGKAFADLGRRQWGGRMQDDVEDALSQVLSLRLADPTKVAICGLSYGGYAALEGAVRNPQLYKVVVSIAGDADLIQTLRSSREDDGADSRAYEYWTSSIGDPKQDEEMLRAASPALHAERMQAPVLLIHGTEDDVVDPKQSKLMAKALETAGKRFEYLELKGEGHTGWSDDTLKLVLKTTCDFIAKALTA